MQNQKTILVAPLHWGLGHATRCIPVIKELIDNDYIPLIASDGAALELLRKEFPQLESIELPSYQITYSKRPSVLKWKLLLHSPKMIRAINGEKKIVKQLVAEGKIQGIISDNRLGVYHKEVPSAFITHQISLKTGSTTWLSEKIHLRFIKKFDACWVPDIKGIRSLSGKLGHPKKVPSNVEYIGPLSRMKKRSLEKKYDILVLLSGPEPQRTILEEKLKAEFKKTNKKIVFVLGKVEPEQTCVDQGPFKVYNFLGSKGLEEVINQSEMVIARSGYTTIMDLAILEKKAFFIPTPGQFEQEYLARRLRSMGIVPSCKQQTFKAQKLDIVNFFKGLKSFESGAGLKSAFSLFESE